MNIKKSFFVIISCVMALSITTACHTSTSNLKTSEIAASKANLSTIVDSLKNDKTVEEYSISHDSKKIAVIKMFEKDLENVCELDVISVDSKKQSTVSITDPFNLHTLEWSYDDKYFSVEDGTSSQCEVHIINTLTLKKCLTLGVASRVVWAPKSNVIAFADVNKSVKEVVATELEGATQIKVCNIDTQKYRTIINANSKYNYDPVKWEETGLSVNSYDYTNEIEGTISLNISD